MATTIRCGNCGGEHTSVAEVRACHSERAPGVAHDEPLPVEPPPTEPAALGPHADIAEPDGPTEAPTDLEPTAESNSGGDRSSDRPAARARRALEHSRGPSAAGGRPTPSPIPVADPAALAGPEVLGRGLLLSPGDVAPGPWAHAERITVDSADADSALDRLAKAHRHRERLVVELIGDLPPSSPSVDSPVDAWRPTTTIQGERLRHLLTANTVDARDPSAVHFPPIQRALALGAELTGPADVLAGGRPVWCDGGPLEPLPALDGSVVPAAHLAAGRLRPLVSRTLDQSELAEDQEAAVGHHGAPARIIAPAGSGKTRVLTERTRRLVSGWGVDPTAICLVAYNRRAREEIAHRTSDLPGLEVRTLNSLALAIATGSGGFGSPSTRRLDTIDERRMRAILGDLVPSRRRRALTDPLEPWIDALSSCRLGLRDPAEVEAELGADVAGFPDVLAAYRSLLADRGLMDFDEQILIAIRRLLSDPEARRRSRERAPILLVDEFQDLTPAHVLLVRLLAGPAAEIMGVGDDDQTIYGFAGADPEWLIDFDDLFPGAESHALHVNYRCPPAVVEAATTLLGHNRHRIVKEIRAAPGRPAEDDALTVTPGLDPNAELANAVNVGIDSAGPAQVAVLGRVRAALLPAVAVLAAEGIPVRRSAGLGPEVLDRAGVAATLAWCRLAIAPSRRLAGRDLATAIRRPPRSLHPRVVEWAAEQTSLSDLRGLAGRLRTERDQLAVSAFADALEQVRAMADDGAETVDLLDHVVEEVGLGKVAGRLDMVQRVPRRAAHSDEIDAVRLISRLQPDPHRFESWLTDLLGRPDAEDGVTLATVHATKGLEWRHVVVAGLDAQLFPHHLAADVEEERRVLHVAITRAAERLTLIPGPRPSSFVHQLSTPADSSMRTAGVTSSGLRRRAGDARGGVTERATKRGTPSLRRSPASSAAAGGARDEALRSWRRERASADGVPPYVVFPDSTLVGILDRLPASLAELSEVSGIGPSRLERYGEEILSVIASISSG